MKAGIALGSNLGESKRVLAQAIEELKKIHTGAASSFLVSSFHETDPVDCPPHSPRFLNAVVQLETELSPNALIKILQRIELDSGRPALHSLNAPRTLDLDLLYCDTITLSTPQLILPHPRMFERLFVLAPLAEIAPELILPGKNQTVFEHLC